MVYANMLKGITMEITENDEMGKQILNIVKSVTKERKKKSKSSHDENLDKLTELIFEAIKRSYNDH